MQSDMHFYGTYVLSRAAGIPRDDAHTIAYASQFVDDSKKKDSKNHPDGGLLVGVATAHHEIQCLVNRAIKRDEQSRVWVPFHFLPGGKGETLEERLLCVKDSKIAQEMIKHHVEVALRCPSFKMELLGIAAHVYMDTFSHYGFSGIRSEYNDIKGKSIKLIDVQDEKMKKYVLKKEKSFLEISLHTISEVFGCKAASDVLESLSGCLGHAGVSTYPDRPFLHWKFTFEKDRRPSNGAYADYNNPLTYLESCENWKSTYEKDRPSNGDHADYNNPLTYLESCEKMHKYLSSFARGYDTVLKQKKFEDFKDKIREILCFEGRKEDRIKQWRSAIRDRTIYESEPDEHTIAYNPKDWESEKDSFCEGQSSQQSIETHAYKFHQAASLHRHYVLKELLPAHGIAIG